jgi:hypothetical protein
MLNPSGQPPRPLAGQDTAAGEQCQDGSPERTAGKFFQEVESHRAILLWSTCDASPGHQVHDYNDKGDDQQKMDQATADIEAEP